jgi:hypothetical protein
VNWVFLPSCAVFLPPPLLQDVLLLVTGQCCCSCQSPCLFTVHMGSGSALLSCGVFLPLPLSQAFPFLVAGRASAPARASPVCPACLFTFLGRIPFPQSSALSVPHPFSSVSLLFLLLISQFLFFSLVGSRSVQGAMLLWPRLVCGSTAVRWSSPCPRLPKPSGRGRLVAWGPSLFLHLTWSGDSLRWLED